jgi:large subunit ribosomal protein L1
MSFKDDQLVDNLNAFVETILKVKPSSAKGQYVKKCVVAGCMTPGVPVSI